MSKQFDAKVLLSQIGTDPGVYQFYDSEERLLYIGKAKNLRRRLSSYFLKKQGHSPKTQILVQQIHDIKTLITQNEEEALLLENNLIKSLKPKYNVVFRDDKAYPYLYLTLQDDFPALYYHRGPKPKQGKCFGPYPNAGAVKETLKLMQKLFQIRSCNLHFFKNRSRPCLQHFIERCPAPCVDYINSHDYYNAVALPVMTYLKGDVKALLTYLAEQMDSAAQQKNYELAAKYRDQIATLRHIQVQQAVEYDTGDTDTVGLKCQGEKAFIIILSVRKGHLVGSYQYLLKNPETGQENELLSDFLPQYYLNAVRKNNIPTRILLSHKLSDGPCLSRVLSQSAGYKVTVLSKATNAQEVQWLKMAARNVKAISSHHFSKAQTLTDQLLLLQSVLGLPTMPTYITCFDVSHTSGQSTVAACVVMTEKGLASRAHRRFKISGIQPGDDYAALYQAVYRYFRQRKVSKQPLPDVLMIDGGKGQLKMAAAALEDLQIIEEVCLLAIAKGPTRKAGREQLYLLNQPNPIRLDPESPALRIIQTVRDKAHQMAITGHRKTFARKHTRSILEDIPGIGPKRRQKLLKSFGGLQSLKRANIDEIAQLDDIDKQLAHRIYHFLKQAKDEKIYED